MVDKPAIIEWENYLNYFDKDYYQMSGYKSGYDKKNYKESNYINRAIPQLIKEVFVDANKFSIDKALDFGCSFGWMVKGMVELNINCFGQDISEYAVKNCDAHVLDRVDRCEGFEVRFGENYDLVYSIDTLDRIPKDRISELLNNFHASMNDGGYVFAVLGLGHNDDRGRDLDQAKQILQQRDWWVNKFKEAGFAPRVDIEGMFYEKDIWVEGMSSGEYLARKHDWNVFVFQKGRATASMATGVEGSATIYDRSLMPVDNTKPSMLVFGSRHGEFYYPDYEFFQIDNWGNYLSYFFNGCYRRVEDYWDNNFMNQYDLVVTALEHDTVEVASEIDFEFDETTKSIAFLDGLLSVMTEKLEHNKNLFDLARKFDVVLAHQPHAKEMAAVYGVETIDCSHIFPLRYFDLHYSKKKHDGFNIYCTGMYGSTANLSCFSANLASKHADNVYMMTHPQYEDEGFDKPDNIHLMERMNQDALYRNILSNCDLVLRMDNMAGVGRGVAEAAAAGIPCISTKDIFQTRCFPELLVPSIDEISMIESLIVKLKTDSYFYNMISDMSRGRLIASNKAEYNTMLSVLNALGFELEVPKELYW